MPILVQSRPRAARSWERPAVLILIALLLLPAFFPWRVSTRRYTFYYHPYDLKNWWVGRYVNSISRRDVVQVSGLGPLRIVCLRPAGDWSRPWPF